VKTILAGVVLIGLSGLAKASPTNLGTFNVSAGGTFLELSAQDNCIWGNKSQDCGTQTFFNPTIVNLTALGVNPGDTLVMTTGGTECYIGTTCQSAPNLGAVFSTSSMLMPWFDANRVVGAVQAVGPGVPTTMYFGSTNTQSYDFKIPGAGGMSVIVPTNAQYLFLGVVDSFYADNSGDPTVTLANAGVAVVPEPATYGFALAGLAMLAAITSRTRSAQKI